MADHITLRDTNNAVRTIFALDVGSGTERLAQGYTLVDSSGAVIAAATSTNQATLNTAVGAQADAAAASDTTTASLMAHTKRHNQRITSLIGLFPATLGQKARTASLGVALSSEDTTAFGLLLSEATFAARVPAAVGGRLPTNAAGSFASLASTVTSLTATAYSAGQTVGGITSFASYIPASPGGCWISELTLITPNTVTLTDIVALVFNANPASSTFSNGTAASLADGDRLKASIVRFDATYKEVAGSRWYQAEPTDLGKVLLSAAGDNLRIALVTNAAIITLPSTGAIRFTGSVAYA